jgi:hypothetical protein
VLERLSIGECISGVRIAGLLDLDPLVVSRWLCGEDLRGVYQPIVLRSCSIEGIDLEGRTFYEMVELVGCSISTAHFARAYFYTNLLIEDCVFDGDFWGQGIQSDGRVVIHNTTFSGWADFGDTDLRGRADLVGVFFSGGTNLLRVLANGARERIGNEVVFRDCRFRPADVPAELDGVQLGITPLVEGDSRGAKGQGG